MPHAAFIAAAPADPTAFHPPPTAAKRRGNPNLALDRYQTHLPPAFAAHLCGQTDLRTGQVCTKPARHDGTCEFVPKDVARAVADDL